MGDLRDTVRLDLADLGLCIRVLLGGRHLQGRSGGGRREEPGSGWYAFERRWPWRSSWAGWSPDRHGSVTIIKNDRGEMR